MSVVRYFQSNLYNQFMPTLVEITLECRISKCTNKDFFWVKSSASREELLKNLDHKIRIIPVLDENKKIVDIITKITKKDLSTIDAQKFEIQAQIHNILQLKREYENIWDDISFDIFWPLS